MSATNDTCIVCQQLGPRHGGLCCEHRYDEQPPCEICTPAEVAAASGLREVLAASLRAEGIAENPAEFDSDIHSWRCSHPDIYGPCSCFREAVDDMTAAVLAWVRDRLASAEVREAVARAILADDIAKGRAADEWGDGADVEWLTDEATAALTAVREALTGHETRSGAPLAGARPEMAPGDHRDDERLAGPGMGEL